MMVASNTLRSLAVLFGSLLAAATTAGACTTYSRTVDATCAQACLNKTVGICPVALVAKLGKLDAAACAASGFTKPNGTKSQKAGPCGNIVFDLFTKATPRGAAASAGVVTLATFDGKSPLTWKTVDDPVMGGKSESFLDMDGAAKALRWHGHVALVPFLKAPGFCTLRSSQASFPDASGTTGIHMRVRNNMTTGLSSFTFQLETKGGRSGFKQGTYAGNVTAYPQADGFVDVMAKWADFDLTWRGQKISGPALADQLDQIQTIGLSTFFPGKVGDFDLEVQSMTAQ
jgi:hypothetical protein